MGAEYLSKTRIWTQISTHTYLASDIFPFISSSIFPWIWMDLSPARRFCGPIGKCWHHGRVEADCTGSATRKRFKLFEKDELEKWWTDHKGSCHQPIGRQCSILCFLPGCELAICYKTRKTDCFVHSIHNEKNDARCAGIGVAIFADDISNIG